MNKRSDALIRAQAKYNEKRKVLARLPASYLTDKENEVFQSALKITKKNKKETILDGLSLIISDHN